MLSDQSAEALLTLSADGAIGADFAGHISAAGLDLLAGVTATPPADRRVRWLREDDNTVATEIYAYDTAGGTNQELRANGEAGGQGFARLAALGDNGGVEAAINALANPVAQIVYAYAGAVNRRIIGADKTSDFLQVDQDKLLLRVGSQVLPAGAAGGRSLDVAHNLNANYNAAVVAAFCIPEWGGTSAAGIGALDNNNYRFGINNTPLGQAITCYWLFIARYN